jgi:hypothetical protein
MAGGEPSTRLGPQHWISKPKRKGNKIHFLRHHRTFSMSQSAKMMRGDFPPATGLDEETCQGIEQADNK